MGCLQTLWRCRVRHGRELCRRSRGCWWATISGEPTLRSWNLLADHSLWQRRSSPLTFAPSTTTSFTWVAIGTATQSHFKGPTQGYHNSWRLQYDGLSVNCLQVDMQKVKVAAGCSPFFQKIPLEISTHKASVKKLSAVWWQLSN